MKSAWMMGAASAVLFSIGCTGTKPELSEDFSSDLAAADGKADTINPSRLKVVGSLDYGDPAASVRYDGKSKYYAYKFGGAKGDAVTIDVTSTNGDAVAWLTDNLGKVIANNDDYNHSTNSHITATLPANKDASIITYYIVFTEYSGHAATFKTTLKGKPAPAPDYFSCKVDSDCVAELEGGCCPHGTKDAINVNQVKAWEATQVCTTTPKPICPLFVINDTRVAECNNSSHKCEMVAIDAIQCGGFIMNHHSCPDGYDCAASTINPDLPGSCVAQPTGVAEGGTCDGFAGPQPCQDGLICVDQPDSCDPNNGGADCTSICVDPTTATKCGGIAGRACAKGFTCVDDPTDSCDPNHGGNDCGGICVAGTVPAPTCVDTVLCKMGTHWSTVQCTCVSDTCVDKIACMSNAHWSQPDCTCVPN